MKKISMFLLIMVSLIVFGIAVNEAEAQAASVVSEESTDAVVSSLFSKFYDDGTYTKDTKIYVDTTKSDLVNEIGVYFHASVPTLERTTYYSTDALWMSRGNGEYSYYGTAYEGEKAVGVTNATATTPYVTPENAPIVLKGEGKNSMDEYYVTLKDFKDNPGAGWGVAGKYYVSTDATVIDNFRLFTAPLWLNTDKSKNYIDFIFATLEVINSNLVMKLWTSEADSGKLIDTETEVVDGVTYYVFSQATIIHKHHHTILNGDTESHWYECECGEKTNVATHTGGTATTTEQAICEVCNQPYGDLVAPETKTYYFAPGVWAGDNAKFVVKVLSASNEEIVNPLVTGESGLYEFTCLAEMTTLCVYRFDETGSEWWNGVEYIEIPSDKNMFAITGWDKESYCWDTYEGKIKAEYGNNFTAGETLYLKLDGGWINVVSDENFGSFICQFYGYSGDTGLLPLELVDSENHIYKVTVPEGIRSSVRFAPVASNGSLMDISDYIHCDYSSSINCVVITGDFTWASQGYWSSYNE